MKKDRKSPPRARNASRTAVSRRRFLGSVAAGVGASSLLQSQFGIVSSVLEAQSPARPQNVRIVTGTQNLLAPSDFRYLGSVGLPLGDGQIIRFGFSTGSLAGRVVGGETHLFATMAQQGAGGAANADQVVEVRYNGIGSRTTVVTNWGDVTKGKRVTGHGNAAPIRGLLWDTVSNQLFWAYGDNYNAGSASWDPSIGTSILAGSNNSGVTAYGPWRTAQLSQRTRGYLYALPSAIQTALGGKRIASGAPITSGNQTSPFGAFATAWTPPTNATPADTVANTRPAISPCTDLIYTDIVNRQARTADCDQCGWTHYGESNRSGNQPQNNPTQNGSGCTVNGDLCGVTLRAIGGVFNTLDQFTAATWIDGPSKQGVVYIGQLCKTMSGQTYAGNGRNHVTYGPTQGPGIHLCPHGQNGIRYCGSTGDSTQTMLSAFYIYNPADLLRVANGTKTAVSVTPVTDCYDMSLISHNGAAFPQIASGLYAYGGCWFEPVSKLLFVTQCGAEAWANEGQPIVHVFSVNC